jgi:polyvinyl alcohol dehydrogenase (cytochrome)
MTSVMRHWGVGAVALGLLLTLVTSAGADDDDWPMFGHDPQGTRFNPGETRLGPATVARLRVLWQHPTPAIVAGTPAVVGNTVFAGDAAGHVYALRADDGTLRWQTTIPGAVFTASPIVLRGRVVLGGQNNGVIYGLDQRTGAVRWQVQPNPFGQPAIWGSGTQVGRYIALGVASNEDVLTFPPDYVFRSRGSLVLLDPRDGRVVWQTFTISDAEAAMGASGAGIWTTPAYDAESHTLYIGTGNNFSAPATGTSDALIAFDAQTGAIHWSNQRTPNDVWNVQFPIGQDFDFGDSPQLYRLPDGRKVLGAGQKSGFYHVLDAATGEVLNVAQFVPGGPIGGLFTDSAVAHGIVFAPGNIVDPANLGATMCALVAIKGDGSGELWRFETFGPEANGVAVANGVVYFKPSVDPHLYAFDLTGTLLAALPVGSSNSGVVVAKGRVFLGLGDVFVHGFPWQFNVPGGIVALGR